MTHYRAVCVHGTVVTQCRCMGPKEDRIVACPSHCKAAKNDKATDRTADRIHRMAQGYFG